jgi:prepilin peptidase CpaA
LAPFWLFNFGGDKLEGLFILILIIILALALYYDLKYRKIPNKLTFSSMALGILLHMFFTGNPWMGAMFSIKGILSAFCIYYILYLVAEMGEGDAKLMMAVGAFGGVPLVLNSTILIALLGVIVASIILIQKKSFIKAIRFNLQYMGYLILQLLSFGKLEEERPSFPGTHKIPYATIIVPSTLCALILI